MTAHPFITPSGSIGYDAQGRRVRVTHNGVTTIQVYDAMGRFAVEYSTQAPAQTNGIYYRTTDHLGSTRIVTDSAGQVKLRRDFFPFGEEIPASASYGNRHQVLDNGVATYNAWSGIPQQFTGQQRDNTGLDYFWARNYFGPSGRFLSVDPGNAGASVGNPQGWNAYAYVLNNPLFLVDRNGLDPSCVHLVCVDVTGRPYEDSSGTTSVILIYPNLPGSVPPDGHIEWGSSGDVEADGIPPTDVPYRVQEAGIGPGGLLRAIAQLAARFGLLGRGRGGLVPVSSIGSASSVWSAISAAGPLRDGTLVPRFFN
jgi:RHS repeat-associated protein